jgi:hypothetical protein
VLREAFRVLKPGGRFAVSDVVTRGEVPADVRKNMLLWAGCIAGALDDSQYAAKLAKAGFEGIGIEPTRVYNIEDARTFPSGQGVDVDAIAPQVEGKFMSAFIRATKPASCCAPGCCSWHGRGASLPRHSAPVFCRPRPVGQRYISLCTGSSAQRQMAEGLLQHDANERFDVDSAGTKASSVRTEAIAFAPAYV